MLLYDAGFEKYIELLSLMAVPTLPIPRLLNDPSGCNVPRLNLE
jgi:hypothetical protein